MSLSICLNCNTKYTKVRIDQKYCKRLCSLQHRYKVHKNPKYSIKWQLESLKKKLDKFDDNKIKKLFKKNKKEILANGYDPKINKKLNKVIGFDKWRKSEIGKNTLKKYYKKNEVREKIKKYNKKYFKQPEVREKRNNYAKQPEAREKRNKWHNDRYKKNPEFKIRKDLAGYVRKSLKKQNVVKNIKFHTLLGCTVKELKLYLEKKFKPGMSWENHGLYGWHIDHIKPVSKFKLINPEEQKKCFHYTNLQPLWAKENIKKGNKY